MRPTFKIAVCVIGLMLANFTSAKDIGRLFFTPEQRAQLDRSHTGDARPDSNDSGLILNGIVQKHGGKRTAWINGVPQTAGDSDEKTPDSMPVTLPGKSKSIKLKVGQRILLSPSAKPDMTQPETFKQDTPKP